MKKIAVILLICAFIIGMAANVSAWYVNIKTYNKEKASTKVFGLGEDIYIKSLESWTKSHTGCKDDTYVNVYFIPDRAFGESFPESQAFAESIWNATIYLDKNGNIPFTQTWNTDETGTFDMLIYGEKQGQGCELLIQKGIEIEDKYSFGVIPEFSTMTAGIALLGAMGFVFLRRKHKLS